MATLARWAWTFLHVHLDRARGDRGGKYQATIGTEHGPRVCFEARKERPGRKPLVARFGGIPLKRQRKAVIDDRLPATVHARFIHNDHLVNAMHDQAFAAISASPGARAYYDELKSREIDHTDALRRLTNRQAGILHGCLKTGAAYDEHIAWGHRSQRLAA